MATTVKIAAMAPAAAVNKRRWKSEFVDCATRLDTDGFPLEGTIAIDHSCPVNLENMEQAGIWERMLEVMRQEVRAKGEEVREASVRARAKMVYVARMDLTPGTLIAIKRGKRVEAFAEITSPYSYKQVTNSPSPGGRHVWSFRVLRRATAEEAGPYGGLIGTYHANAVPLPADLHRR